MAAWRQLRVERPVRMCVAGCGQRSRFIRRLAQQDDLRDQRHATGEFKEADLLNEIGTFHQSDERAHTDLNFERVVSVSSTIKSVARPDGRDNRIWEAAR